MTKLPIFIAAIVACGASIAETQTVVMQAEDGVTVHGEIYTSAGVPKTAPLILLFHQGGGDSRGEYAAVVPRLLDNGFNVIAIDQRRGGNRFGGVNRTSTDVNDQVYGYCDVYPDLEAALRFARKRGFGGPTAAWGSSYSAALVFRLGTEHPNEVRAILAFSPASGEAMNGCRAEDSGASLAQPVLVLRPIGEMEVPAVAAQMARFAEHGYQTYVADPGVHGSSMLNAARVGAPVDATWQVVLDFLNESLGE
jgi:pimeloyl-ACP methyl ester carboxylesterase